MAATPSETEEALEIIRDGGDYADLMQRYENPSEILDSLEERGEIKTDGSVGFYTTGEPLETIKNTVLSETYHLPLSYKEKFHTLMSHGVQKALEDEYDLNIPAVDVRQDLEFYWPVLADVFYRQEGINGPSHSSLVEMTDSLGSISDLNERRLKAIEEDIVDIGPETLVITEDISRIMKEGFSFKEENIYYPEKEDWGSMIEEISARTQENLLRREVVTVNPDEIILEGGIAVIQNGEEHDIEVGETVGAKLTGEDYMGGTFELAEFSH